MVIGLGGGWQWIETPKTKMSFELGGASLYEQFKGSTKNSELSAQVGYNLDHKITDTVDFIHDLTYYPSTDKFSDYYLATGAELRAHFSSRMFANFKALFNYDATPAPTKGSTDVKYILGIGVDF
jgi:putative salt-induced outer membrane protein YdiY